MGSDAGQESSRFGSGTNGSVCRLPLARRDVQDRKVLAKRLRPTAFLIGRKSFSLSRISMIFTIFDNRAPYE
jgi:hypothetical protein